MMLATNARGTVMRWSDWAWAVARCLYGLVFIGLTAVVIIQFGGNHPPEVNPAAGDFTGALNRTGFMNPLLTGTLLLGGMALLFDRTAPIGLLLVAPSVVVIALFHWLLTHTPVWGSIWPIWWAVLAWRYRSVFARLLQPRTKAPAAETA